MGGDGSGWTPCARCRSQRDRCPPGSCKYAPYFPADQPKIFEMVHAVFGGHKAMTTLESLPEDKRAAAMTNMFHDAVTRFNDPVNGCSGKMRALEVEVQALKSQQTAPIGEVGGLQMHQSQPMVALTRGVQMPLDPQMAALNGEGQEWDPVNGYSSLICSLEQKVAELNTVIENLNGQLGFSNSENLFLEEQLAERDAEVEHLKDLLMAAQSNSNPNPAT